MAIFSDPWNTATPAGSDSRAQGDDRMREIKRAFLERYTLEHEFDVATGAGNGRHKFPSGNTASRPTDVTAGALYINTETGDLETYNGSSWVKAGNYLLRTGDVMTAGHLELFQQPSINKHAANKGYVDDMSAMYGANSSAGLTLTTTPVAVPGLSSVAGITGTYVTWVWCWFAVVPNGNKTLSAFARWYKNGSNLGEIVALAFTNASATANGVAFMACGFRIGTTITAGDTLEIRCYKDSNNGTASLLSAKVMYQRATV